jgi:hypothetical protein
VGTFVFACSSEEDDVFKEEEIKEKVLEEYALSRKTDENQ